MCGKVKAGVALWMIGTSLGWAQAQPQQAQPPVPAEQAFAFEGSPTGIEVAEQTILVSYGLSRAMFDRTTGAFLNRRTSLDGWTEPPDNLWRAHTLWALRRLAGPGVVYQTNGVVATADFQGKRWQAIQPDQFLRSLHRREPNWAKHRETFGSWTKILNMLNAESYVQAGLDKHTMETGLASNIVTHLVEAQGRLWAACVDIYDPARQAWGPGGLCCYDPAAGRWKRVDAIEGHSVRWVTLLQRVGDDLWVGFREGDGVEGDSVHYGKGISPGDYRPRAKAIVLGRLSAGKWTVFSRPPVPDPDPWGLRTPASGPAKPHWPSEEPEHLAVDGQSVILFSACRGRASGNWEASMNGHVSLLNTADGTWRTVNVERDLGAGIVLSMTADKGEVLLATNRGAHHWRGPAKGWTFLDTGSPVRNPSISEVLRVGDETWFGYTNQAFSVIGRQGISRYHEKTGRWSYFSPEEIGTSCPVRRMALVGADVWVLFAQRPWLGSAGEHPFLPGERRLPASGIGRYADGKWTFPVKLDNSPSTIERERWTNGVREMVKQQLPIEGMVGVGDRLFIANELGVFAGPGGWKRIVDLTGTVRAWVAPAVWMEPSSDGKALLVYHQLSETWRFIEYDLGSGTATVRSLKTGDRSPETQRLQEEFHRRAGLGDPDIERSRRKLRTPWSQWTILEGQLIRQARDASP